MAWHWIWNLFYKWGEILYIFTSAKHKWKYEEISCLMSEINYIFNVKSIKFSVYELFGGGVNMYLSNLRYCVQYTTGRNNSLLFSYCKISSISWIIKRSFVEADFFLYFHKCKARVKILFFKILSHEWNKRQNIKFSVYYIFFRF